MFHFRQSNFIRASRLESLRFAQVGKELFVILCSANLCIFNFSKQFSYHYVKVKNDYEYFRRT